MNDPDVTSIEVISVLQTDNQLPDSHFTKIKDRIYHVNHWLSEFGNPPDKGYFMLIIVDNVPQYWYRLANDEINIGRAEDNDIILEHDNISRLHCMIRKNNQSWQIVDNDSKNGLLVNGEKTMDRLLCDGDIVVIANTELIFLNNV